MDAIARLALVRTLRELGLDLPTIRRVVDREVSLPQVAASHAEALDVQLRTLRLRRSLLAAAAERGSTPEELELMHRLATLSEDERRRLIRDFLGTVFDGLDTHPAFGAVIRSLTPELPEEPTTEQIQAWVELAELFQDSGFRGSMQRMARNLAADRAADATTGVPRVLAAVVRSLAEPGAGRRDRSAVTAGAAGARRPCGALRAHGRPPRRPGPAPPTGGASGGTATTAAGSASASPRGYPLLSPVSMSGAVLYPATAVTLWIDSTLGQARPGLARRR